MIKFFRKYHKWLGLILTIFIILFAISGIVLNHRKLFSFIDVNRKLLPESYHYKNWNNASVKGAVSINNKDVLIYGNIGVWKTDSLFSTYTDFNSGFNKGVDNRKVSCMLYSSKNELFAGTYFGLYKWNSDINKWIKIKLPVKEERITDIIEKDSALIVMTRSHILSCLHSGNFKVETLKAPENYDNKVGLFKTIWLIHSGEIFGHFGKIIVDISAIILIFLSITGLIFFINRYRFKRNKKRNKGVKKIQKSSKWNLKWHNKIGWTTVVVLIIITFTGMFLRPPLLIAIIKSKVPKIPFTILNTNNAWFDKLRAIKYDDAQNRYIISTSEGMYYVDKQLKNNPKLFDKQPPVSVMGINVFEKISENTFLIGSFSGVFKWNTKNNTIIDAINNKPYSPPKSMRKPIGDNAISGYIKNYKEKNIYFDYRKGAISPDKEIIFTDMPLHLINTPMSLWNLALEIHTGRLYKVFLGDFYILFIPLSGFILLFILVSGFVVWYKKHRKKRK